MSFLFLWSTGTMRPSDIYTFDTLVESVSYAYEIGHARKRFYIGSIKTTNSGDNRFTSGDNQSTPDVRYGLVNIAAFLAISQPQSINANACDEYHLDSIDSKYAISNACGQFGEDYQEDTCSSYAEKAMECPVTTDVEATAVASGKYAKSLVREGFDCDSISFALRRFIFYLNVLICVNQYEYRPNFYCGNEAFTGFYDPASMFVQRGPFANRAGRTDVKSCCFWGRGALMTKGVCMLGKLNYYMGAGAAKDGRPAKFPDIDFCEGEICKSIKQVSQFFMQFISETT